MPPRRAQPSSADGRSERPTAQKLDPAVALHRRFFLVILAGWLVAPLLLTGVIAQDATAFLAGGKLASSDPAAAYAVDFGRGPDSMAPADDLAAFSRYTETYCDTDPTGSCDRVIASYLSPPPALLIYSPLASLPTLGGILAVRWMAAVPLAIGMELLWRLLEPRDARTARVLVLSTALATPIALNTIILGQNSPLMFLSVCLGVSRFHSWKGDAAVAVVLALITMLKVFPALLLGLLLWQRRWRVLSLTFGLLMIWTLASFPFFPPDPLWDRFAEAFKVYRDWRLAHHYNRSFDSFLRVMVLPDIGPGVVTTTTYAARLVLVGLLWIWRVRKVSDDLQWVFAWIVAIVLNDYVWPHYFLVLIPAATWLAAARHKLHWLLPVAAAMSVVLVGTWDTPLPGNVATTAAMTAALFAVPLLAPLRKVVPRNVAESN